jgi:hypothetical protein
MSQVIWKIVGNFSSLRVFFLIKKFFSSSFEDLLKAFEKAKPVIAKEEKGVVPRFYIRYRNNQGCRSGSLFFPGFGSIFSHQF